MCQLSVLNLTDLIILHIANNCNSNNRENIGSMYNIEHGIPLTEVKKQSYTQRQDKKHIHSLLNQAVKQKPRYAATHIKPVVR